MEGAIRRIEYYRRIKGWGRCCLSSVKVQFVNMYFTFTILSEYCCAYTCFSFSLHFFFYLISGVNLKNKGIKCEGK